MTASYGHVPAPGPASLVLCGAPFPEPGRSNLPWSFSEEADMPDKLKEFVRETMDELLKSLPPEERVKGLSAEELVRALPPEILEELARKLKANGPSAKPQ